MKAGETVPPEVARAEVVAADGTRVALGSLWAKQPCLLVFLRHFGCVGCSEQLYELVPRLGEIARAGTRTVFVGNGSREQRDAFVVRHALGDSVTVLTDPDRIAYQALFFARSWWATLGPRALVNIARAMAHGHPHRGVEGDATQQGGTLLVDTNGVVRFFRASRALGDHPPASDLVEAVLKLAALTSQRSSQSRAFV